jgi:hypothetical protein
MAYQETIAFSSRTFRYVIFWSMCVLIVVAIFIIILLVLDLMKDSSEYEMYSTSPSKNEPFQTPDIGYFLTWGFYGQGVEINVSKLCTDHQAEYKVSVNKVVCVLCGVRKRVCMCV